MEPRRPTRVAVTGAAGFLGRCLARELAAHFPVRALDVVPVSGIGNLESRIGDVSRLEDAMALCEGCSDLVISHMAPNRPEVYGTPALPFDVNVKGAAHLFHAAAAQGIRRVAVVSSTAVVQERLQAGEFLDRGLPPSPVGLYGLTKALQEEIARYYHRSAGIEAALLRPAYVCDEDSLSDKYGRRRPTVNWQFIDPRDIAEAVRLALVAPRLGCEVFYLLGPSDAGGHADVRHARDVLGWEPRHTFSRHPRDGEAASPA